MDSGHFFFDKKCGRDTELTRGRSMLGTRPRVSVCGVFAHARWIAVIGARRASFVFDVQSEQNCLISGISFIR